MIELEINKSKGYYLTVANSKRKDVEVIITESSNNFGLSIGFCCVSAQSRVQCFT